MSGPRSLRLAHRGDWRVAPENTLAAFAAAMRVPGCDGVEFDVQMCGDGTPVILHDESLARVQRRPGRVAALGAAELAVAGVPTLAEAMALLGREPFLDVELKGDDHADATAAVLRDARGGEGPRTVISSFDPPSLAAMADRLPAWTRWLNAEDLAPGTLSLALGLGCRGVSVLWGAITPAAVGRAHGAGLDVAAWTVRRRATFKRLERLGVVACCVEAAALDGDAAVPAG
ncbi:MAG TPA: glycerophosphodiester phosphodiesterase [Candidatus Limnocylindrales bacterium]